MNKSPVSKTAIPSLCNIPTKRAVCVPAVKTSAIT